jgi:hypothetical protein
MTHASSLIASSFKCFAERQRYAITFYTLAGLLLSLLASSLEKRVAPFPVLMIGAVIMIFPLNVLFYWILKSFRSKLGADSQIKEGFEINENLKFNKAIKIESEEDFLTLLNLERKRCERSDNQFGLALIKVSYPANAIQLRDSLCSQMRKTDIVGWYRGSSVIGIIFTELHLAPIPVLKLKLRAKIDETVRTALSPEDLKKVEITLLLFPNDIKNEHYPELEIIEGKGRGISKMIS